MWFSYSSAIGPDANRALIHVYCGRIKNKLRFSPSKTKSMVVIKKLKYNDPVVHMNGEQISLVGEIRLFGLTIDRTLTLIPHDTKACKRNIHFLERAALETAIDVWISRWHFPEIMENATKRIKFLSYSSVVIDKKLNC
ncbi:hypothetical protein EVAR_47027_1 [Eumeta japonica]|uniref:Uncharacterized protein n=1 Tax=Eumeta variegata TaxID=151549 RepID=A0A4C1XHL9_EUMVA|nr:hypothetical protein EVAR_47027_1 [Eumeta japonica]